MSTFPLWFLSAFAFTCAVGGAYGAAYDPYTVRDPMRVIIMWAFAFILAAVAVVLALIAWGLA